MENIDFKKPKYVQEDSTYNKTINADFLDNRSAFKLICKISVMLLCFCYFFQLLPSSEKIFTYVPETFTEKDEL